MLIPGEWGFYESYSTLVRVEGFSTSSNSSRHTNSYFRGVLVDLSDNFATEYKENLLVTGFWTKDSCSDPNILVKFGLGEVAYNTWYQSTIGNTNKPPKNNSRKTKGNMGNISNTNNSLQEDITTEQPINENVERSAAETEDNEDTDDAAIDARNFPKQGNKYISYSILSLLINDS